MSGSEDDKRFDFEAALEELERLVNRLEQGDLPLEESLKEFERGVALTRSCQQELKNAEQKVRKLTEEGDTEDFDADELV
ncbi:MAG: exodeoxyribonuclease VII small subunit [Gammaproteobacteria bacterium]|nr:MAG: exodeoxyribonuclease VII small subunit [Gammaproteobacteria bacterium]